MPLTAKGEEIKSALSKEYGAEKGESVLYAGKNKGTFTGIDAEEKQANIYSEDKYTWYYWPKNGSKVGPFSSSEKARKGAKDAGYRTDADDGPTNAECDNVAAFMDASGSENETRYNEEAVNKAIEASNRRGQKVSGREAKMIHALLRGRQGRDDAMKLDAIYDGMTKLQGRFDAYCARQDSNTSNPLTTATRVAAQQVSGKDVPLMEYALSRKPPG